MEWQLKTGYRNREIVRGLLDRIHAASRTPVRLMEVCGTHTTAIFRNGIQGLLPDTVSLVSGPGCPVCVTPTSEIDACIALSRIDDVIVATFGDMMRVPGTDSSLQTERGRGGDIRVVHGALDALGIAEKNPEKQVVLLGVGFETTAPTIAAAINMADEKGLDNYSVLSLHKRILPALAALTENQKAAIDGFILPGHVSVIIGAAAYRPFFAKARTPAVIAGFEPADILNAVDMLTRQIEAGAPALVNGYPRAVTSAGNTKAKRLMANVFEARDVMWRGLGMIPRSGCNIRPTLDRFDAEKKFGIRFTAVSDPKGCICGDIIAGAAEPKVCPHYGAACTPETPVGPCMVSSEGTCAAHYRYTIPKGKGK